MTVRYATIDFGSRKIPAVLVEDETTADSELEAFRRELAKDPAFGTAVPYGLDFEWTMDRKTRERPTGRAGAGNPIATVQLACERRALVFHLSGRLGHRLPESLRRFLLDKRYLPVGCNMASGDEWKLRAWH